jgi:hypothetical protein
MRLYKVIFITGLLVAAVPQMGLPQAFDKVFALAAGSLLAVLGLVVRSTSRRYAVAQRIEKVQDNGVFVESGAPARVPRKAPSKRPAQKRSVVMPMPAEDPGDTTEYTAPHKVGRSVEEVIEVQSS